MSHWQDGFTKQGLAGTVERAPTMRMSRGQALRRGAAAVGAVGAVGLLDAAPAFAWLGAQPRPIPGGFDDSFNLVPKHPFIHVLPPALGFEMSTITDFRGKIAAGETQGSALGSDGTSYAFDTDMRFMQGTYVGRDGRRRVGSFGFVWIDLFTGAVGDLTTQVHDFEPGIRASGLFWTVAMPGDAMQGHVRTGRARFHRRHLAVPDFHDFLNAVSPSPVSRPGHVSFDVHWHGDPHDKQWIRDTTFGFEGEFVPCEVTIDFRVKNDHRDVVYTSVAHGQTTVAGAIGHERNGVFARG